MKKHFLIITIVVLQWLNCGFSSAQSYKISGNIKGYDGKIYLFSYFGERKILIDSSIVNKGDFQLNVKENSPVGMYKIAFFKEFQARYQGDKEVYFDLIFNKENIFFTTDATNIQDSLKFIQSEENKILYDYMRNDAKVWHQLQAMSQAYTSLDEKDSFRKVMEEKYNQLRAKHNVYTENLLVKNLNTFAFRYIKSTRSVMPPIGLNDVEMQGFIKTHYFDFIDFKDTNLLYSDLFTTHSFGFVKLSIDYGIAKPEQQKKFIAAIDTIFSKAKANDRVFSMIRNYIIKGFEYLDMEIVLSHIAEHYMIQESCEDEAKQNSRLKMRLDAFKKLATGQIAPDFSFNSNGKTVALANIEAPYTIVIFWASTCPHCIQILPEVYKLYQQQKTKKFEVVAISLDMNKVEYETYFNKQKFSWINYCDFMGWDGKIASDYCVYATPTMILLDKDKRVVAKPTSFPELMDELKGIL